MADSKSSSVIGDRSILMCNLNNPSYGRGEVTVFVPAIILLKWLTFKLIYSNKRVSLIAVLLSLGRNGWLQCRGGGSEHGPGSADGTEGYPSDQEEVIPHEDVTTMLASCHGSIVLITDPLWGESTGQRRFPSRNGHRELRYYIFISLNKLLHSDVHMSWAVITLM